MSHTTCPHCVVYGPMPQAVESLNLKELEKLATDLVDGCLENSKPETEVEMATIELPVDQIAHVAEHGQPNDYENEVWQDACKKTMDARKSKYDLWIEDMLHVFNADSQVSDMATRLVKEGWSTRVAKLMSASPNMAAALVNVYQRDPNMLKKLGLDAIKAALPTDVAKELLGE